MAPRSRKKKQADVEQALRDSNIPPDRPGLPAKDSIESIETFVSPKGEQYKILHTSEANAYDEKTDKS